MIWFWTWKVSGLNYCLLNKKSLNSEFWPGLKKLTMSLKSRKDWPEMGTCRLWFIWLINWWRSIKSMELVIKEKDGFIFKIMSSNHRMTKITSCLVTWPQFYKMLILKINKLRKFRKKKTFWTQTTGKSRRKMTKSPQSNSFLIN